MKNLFILQVIIVLCVGISTASFAQLPDFVITSVSGPTTGTTGQTATVTISARNQGGAVTQGSYVVLRMILSPDAQINLGDTYYQDVQVLNTEWAGGATVTKTFTYTIPSGLSGTYYWGAYVDAAGYHTESNENNNALAGNTVSISAPVVLPDFVITSVSGPTTGTTGQTATVTISARNQGGAVTQGSYVVLRMILSPDAQINLGDTYYQDVQVLNTEWAGGATVTKTFTYTIPSGLSGTYYWGAYVDAAGYHTESNENNNALAGNTVSISAPVVLPDFVITSVSGPTTGTTGQTATVTISARNQGGAVTQGSYVVLRMILSPDAQINLGDTYYQDVQVLNTEWAGGATVTKTFTYTIPSGLSGTYYWGAYVDAAGYHTESNENNNALAGNTVSISAPVVLPDFVITSVSGPTTGTTGQTATVTISARNQGGAVTQGSYVVLRMILSPDAQINLGDTYYQDVQVLNTEWAGGATVTKTFTYTIPSGLSGTYYWGAYVDAAGFHTESNENNNALAGNTVAIKLQQSIPAKVIITTPKQTYSFGETFSYNITVLDSADSPVPGVVSGVDDPIFEQCIVTQPTDSLGKAVYTGTVFSKDKGLIYIGFQFGSVKASYGLLLNIQIPPTVTTGQLTTNTTMHTGQQTNLLTNIAGGLYDAVKETITENPFGAGLGASCVGFSVITLISGGTMAPFAAPIAAVSCDQFLSEVAENATKATAKKIINELAIDSTSKALWGRNVDEIADVYDVMSFGYGIRSGQFSCIGDAKMTGGKIRLVGGATSGEYISDMTDFINEWAGTVIIGGKFIGTSLLTPPQQDTARLAVSYAIPQSNSDTIILALALKKIKSTVNLLGNNRTNIPNNCFIEANNYLHTVSIKYGLSTISNVGVTIFNQTGQKVFAANYNNQSAGVHNIILNARNYAPGVYFFEIRYDNLSIIKHHILLN